MRQLVLGLTLGFRPLHGLEAVSFRRRRVSVDEFEKPHFIGHH